MFVILYSQCFHQQQKTNLEYLFFSSLFVCVLTWWWIYLGLRAVNSNWDPGDAASSQRDGTRLHIRHTKAAADDHVRSRQGVDPNVPQLTRPSVQHDWPADVGDRLRGNGADLHVARRGPESKADDVHGSHSAYSFALACFIFPSVVFAPVATRAWPLARRRPPFSRSFPSRSAGTTTWSRPILKSIRPSRAISLCFSRVSVSRTQ